LEEEHEKLASLAVLATLVMPGDTPVTGKRCATAACGACALRSVQSSLCCCCCCRRWSSRHPSHDEPEASKPKHGDQARQARQIAVNFVQNPGPHSDITAAARAVGYPTENQSAKTALHKAHHTVWKKLKQGAMPSPTVSPLVSPSAAAAASAPEEPTPAGSTPANDASTNDPATAPPKAVATSAPTAAATVAPSSQSSVR
jgi:hypothetical protein